MSIRLNNVTRDLNVGIQTAVEFLQKKGFAVESNPNAKITDEQYAKVNFRRRQAALSYPEKVRQLVELQKRLVPIYAMRGKVIVPWADV